MKNQNVIYMRVSSVSQNLDRQENFTGEVKIDKVFEEKASGKDIRRPVLSSCMDYLREGDTLHVLSIDRLARNLKDLQDIITKLNEKKVTIKFYKENLSFSGKADAMSKLMLQMMGAFAEFERSLIRERQAEGIANALAKGRKWGRAKSLSPEQVEEIKKRVNGGEEKKALAKKFNVSRTTLYSVLKSKK